MQASAPARLAWAFSSCGCYDARLFEEVCRTAHKMLGLMQPSEVALLVQALAQSGHPVPFGLLARIARHTLVRLPACSLPDLGAIMGGLADMGAQHEELWKVSRRPKKWEVVVLAD